MSAKGKEPAAAAAGILYYLINLLYRSAHQIYISVLFYVSFQSWTEGKQPGVIILSATYVVAIDIGDGPVRSNVMLFSLYI
jgi:hypothetical protein